MRLLLKYETRTLLPYLRQIIRYEFRDLQYKLIEIQTQPVCIWLYFYIYTNNVRNVRSCFASEHNVAVNIVCRFAYVVSFVASPGVFRVVFAAVVNATHDMRSETRYDARHAKRHTTRHTTLRIDTHRNIAQMSWSCRMSTGVLVILINHMLK